MRGSWRMILLSLAAAALLACTRGPVPAPADPGTQDGPNQPQAPAAPGGGESGPIAGAVRRVEGCRYAVYGRTSAPSPLTLWIRQGDERQPHALVQVGEDRRFRQDLFLGRPGPVTLELTDAGDRLLASVAVDPAQDVVTFGQGYDPDDLPPLDHPPAYDRRTCVTADRIESPHFQIPWPAVMPGDPQVVLSGRTDLPTFRVEVRRDEEVRAAATVSTGAANGAWADFQVTLAVPGGFDTADAIVLLTGSDEIELYFQPIRN